MSAASDGVAARRCPRHHRRLPAGTNCRSSTGHPSSQGMSLPPDYSQTPRQEPGRRCLYVRPATSQNRLSYTANVRLELIARGTLRTSRAIWKQGSPQTHPPAHSEFRAPAGPWNKTRLCLPPVRAGGATCMHVPDASRLRSAPNELGPCAAWVPGVLTLNFLFLSPWRPGTPVRPMKRG